MNAQKQYKIQISNLIAEKKFSEAYQICNKILSYDPENSTFLRLRNKIEKEVEKHNKKVIEDELKKLDKLLIDRKYEEYIKKLANLQNYSGDSEIINEKILSAKLKLDQKYNEINEQQFYGLSVKVPVIKEKDDLMDALASLGEFKKQNIHHFDIKILEVKIKNQFIKHQIESNIGLINSSKFEEIMMFLLKLQHLQPQNNILNDYIVSTKNRYQEYKIENQKDYIFKTIDEIKTLFIKKKYDYCIQLSNRILEIDPNNNEIKNIRKRSQSLADRSSATKISKRIFKNYKLFKKSNNFLEKNYISI